MSALLYNDTEAKEKKTYYYYVEYQVLVKLSDKIRVPSPTKQLQWPVRSFPFRFTASQGGFFT